MDRRIPEHMPEGERKLVEVVDKPAEADTPEAPDIRASVGTPVGVGMAEEGARQTQADR